MAVKCYLTLTDFNDNTKYLASFSRSGEPESQTKIPVNCENIVIGELYPIYARGTHFTINITLKEKENKSTQTDVSDYYMPNANRNYALFYDLDNLTDIRFTYQIGHNIKATVAFHRLILWTVNETLRYYLMNIWTSEHRIIALPCDSVEDITYLKR